MGDSFVRVKEYMHERVADRGRGIQLARKEGWIGCMDREWWRLFRCRNPFGGCSQRERGVKNYKIIYRIHHIPFVLHWILALFFFLMLPHLHV